MKKVFVFWLALFLLPAIALATAGPSLAANCSPTSWCKDPSMGCDFAIGETYRGDLVCPDNGNGELMSCCVPAGAQTPPPPPTCPGTCKTNCSMLSDEQVWSGGLTNCASTVNPLCCVATQSNPGAGGAGQGCPNALYVNTAIGCLMAGDPKQLVSQLLGWGVGIGGGIAFLMIIFAGFQMTTASGDPKRVKAAQELLTSALAGLILIVISLVLLNFIGVSVLGLNKIGFSLWL